MFAARAFSAAFFSFSFFTFTFFSLATSGAAAPLETGAKLEQPGTPRLLTKTLRPEYSIEESFPFSFGSALGNLVATPRYSREIYDDLTLYNLRKISDDARPLSERADDLEYSKTRRAAGRAMTIQTTRSLSTMLDQSELRGPYRIAIAKFQKLQRALRVAITDDGETVAVSRGTPRGKKLLELSLEINPSRGVDPQIQFTPNFKFRYDYTEQVPVVEYEVRF